MPSKTVRRAAAIFAAIGLLPIAKAANATAPTDIEQFLLESINRARFDPAAEAFRYPAGWGETGTGHADLNEGITSNFLTPETRQPLAFSPALVQAARDYSTTILANNVGFTHTYNGTTPQSRAVAAGFPFSDPSGIVENITLIAGAASSTPSFATDSYQRTFIDGHTTDRVNRRTFLDGSSKEIGIGYATNVNYKFSGFPGGTMMTFDMGYSQGSASGNAFLTGVAYSDSTDNNFYDIGEGLGGIVVSAVRKSDNAAFSTTTFSTGGYSLPVPAGAYDVTFAGAGLAAGVVHSNVIVGATNVKIDATADMGVWNNIAGGAWTNAANWSGQVPSGSGRTAIFGGKITGPQAITFTGIQSVGAMLFDSDQSYKLALASGTGRISLAMPGQNVDSRIDVLRGAHEISAPVNSGFKLDVMVQTGASLRISAGLNALYGVTKFGQGTLTLASDQNNFASPVVGEGTLIVETLGSLSNSTMTLGFGSQDAALMLNVAGTVRSQTVNVAVGLGLRDLGSTLTSGTVTAQFFIDLKHDLRIQSAAGGTIVFPWSITDSLVDGKYPTIFKLGGGAAVLQGSEPFHAPIVVQEGKLVLSGSASNSASLTVARGAVQLTVDQTFKALDVQKQSVGTQSFDLSNHSIKIFAADLVSAQTTLASQIAIGGTDGFYDSTATADSAVGYHIVNNSYLLVKKTVNGDATLDGRCDFADLVTVAQNYGDHDALWPLGDFNGDGEVGFADLVVLAQHYGGGSAAPIPGADLAFNDDLGRAFASIPEPANLCCVIGAGIALTGRRRRFI